MNADKLASFRVDSDLWQQFQGHAKENNTNASALLVAYIKSVVNTSNVITSNLVVNTSSEVNSPSLSIQDIDNRIDDKIKQSIQNINTLSIQDIDNCIDDSLVDGKIKEAIATSYAGMMGNFNGLLEELQDIKSQLQELQIPPSPVPCSQLPIPDDQLPMTNYELPTTNDQLSMTNDQLLIPDDQLPITDDQLPTTDDQLSMINDQLPITDDQLSMTNDQLPITDESDRTAQNIIELLNIGGIVQGELYNAESLEDDGIFDSISKNQDIFEALVGEKPTSKKDTADVNKILKIMGYQIERTTKDKKKYNRVKLPK